MDNFVAVDVETANQHRTSICSIGAVKVENGIITDSFYTLVKPYPNFYISRFTDEIHGISRADTDNAPLFSEVWPEFMKWIGNLPLVAHNCPFDRGCISASLRHYGLEPLGNRPFLCTLAKARTTIPRTICGSFSLPHLASFMGIPFNNHHNALADAEACAKIAIALL